MASSWRQQFRASLLIIATVSLNIASVSAVSDHIVIDPILELTNKENGTHPIEAVPTTTSSKPEVVQSPFESNTSPPNHGSPNVDRIMNIDNLVQTDPIRVPETPTPSYASHPNLPHLLSPISFHPLNGTVPHVLDPTPSDIPYPLPPHPLLPLAPLPTPAPGRHPPPTVTFPPQRRPPLIFAPQPRSPPSFPPRSVNGMRYGNDYVRKWGLSPQRRIHIRIPPYRRPTTKPTPKPCKCPVPIPPRCITFKGIPSWPVSMSASSTPVHLVANIIEKEPSTTLLPSSSATGPTSGVAEEAHNAHITTVRPLATYPPENNDTIRNIQTSNETVTTGPPEPTQMGMAPHDKELIEKTDGHLSRPGFGLGNRHNSNLATQSSQDPEKIEVNVEEHTRLSEETTIDPVTEKAQTNDESNDDSSSPQPEFSVPDELLENFTEELFAKAKPIKYVTLNSLKLNADPNATDSNFNNSDSRLLNVQKEAYEIPTVKALRSLYENYEYDMNKEETASPAKRERENDLLDVFLKTDVMHTAMQLLADAGYIDPNEYEWKYTLRDIWMRQNMDVSAGFEAAFMAEQDADLTIVGGHNWVYFDYLESRKAIDYLNMTKSEKINDDISLVNIVFKINGVLKPNTRMLVSTSPELEMALYTLCFHVRRNDYCPISLGGTRLIIGTHAVPYFGKDLLYDAYIVS